MKVMVRVTTLLASGKAENRQQACLLHHLLVKLLLMTDEVDHPTSGTPIEGSRVAKSFSYGMPSSLPGMQVEKHVRVAPKLNVYQ